jgi:hypothetical protein
MWFSRLSDPTSPSVEPRPLPEKLRPLTAVHGGRQPKNEIITMRHLEFVLSLMTGLVTSPRAMEYKPKK